MNITNWKKSDNYFQKQIFSKKVDNYLFKKIFEMLFTPSNSTTGFLLQTMLYVANITKHDFNAPRSRDEFLLTPMGADSGKSKWLTHIQNFINKTSTDKQMNSLIWILNTATGSIIIIPFLNECGANWWSCILIELIY